MHGAALFAKKAIKQASHDSSVVSMGIIWLGQTDALECIAIELHSQGLTHYPGNALYSFCLTGSPNSQTLDFLNDGSNGAD